MCSLFSPVHYKMCVTVLHWTYDVHYFCFQWSQLPFWSFTLHPFHSSSWNFNMLMYVFEICVNESNEICWNMKIWRTQFYSQSLTHPTVFFPSGHLVEHSALHVWWGAVRWACHWWLRQASPQHLLPGVVRRGHVQRQVQILHRWEPLVPTKRTMCQAYMACTCYSMIHFNIIDFYLLTSIYAKT